MAKRSSVAVGDRDTIRRGVVLGDAAGDPAAIEETAADDAADDPAAVDDTAADDAAGAPVDEAADAEVAADAGEDPATPLSVPHPASRAQAARAAARVDRNLMVVLTSRRGGQRSTATRLPSTGAHSSGRVDHAHPSGDLASLTNEDHSCGTAPVSHRTSLTGSRRWRHYVRRPGTSTHRPRRRNGGTCAAGMSRIAHRLRTRCGRRPTGRHGREDEAMRFLLMQAYGGVELEGCTPMHE
jgi:hypothetical protein